MTGRECRLFQGHVGSQFVTSQRSSAVQNQQNVIALEPGVAAKNRAIHANVQCATVRMRESTAVWHQVTLALAEYLLHARFGLGVRRQTFLLYQLQRGFCAVTLAPQIVQDALTSL